MDGDQTLRDALREVLISDVGLLACPEIDRLESWLTAPADTGAVLDEIRNVATRDPALASYLEGVLFTVLVSRWKSSQPTPAATEILGVLSGFADLRRMLHPPPPAASGDRSISVPDFLSVAHDLLSPITSIVFLSSALQNEESGPLNEKQKRHLSVVASAALSLSNFVKDLVVFTNPDSARMEANPSVFSTQILFESIRDLISPYLVVKELSLDLVTPEHDNRVGFPVAISRVLLNLATNALKVTSSGGILIAAREVSESRVEFSVRDTGPGIVEKDLDNLASAYRKGDGARGFDSFGLGLTICRKILRNMSSELKFESLAVGGTRFYFEVDLPRSTR